MDLRNVRRLAIIGCGAALLLLALMMTVTLPTLRGLSGGLEPFDLRAGGYTFDEARDLLLALGDSGRGFYRTVQLPLDCLLAVSYALGIVCAVVWLLRSGGGRVLPKRSGQRTGQRSGGRVMAAIRSVFFGAPLLAAVFDLRENWLVYRMLGMGDGVPFPLVAEASRTTTYKAVFVAIALLSLALAVADYLIRRRKQHARG